jgi:hypothetical protein
MSAGGSRLPPSNPALRAISKSGLKPAVLRLKEAQAPAGLKRELGRLDPRMQCLEDEISAVREQIPAGFADQLAALKRELDAAESTPATNASAVGDSQQFEVLRSAVSERITKVFGNFRNTDFEPGIAAATTTNNSVERLRFDENDGTTSTAGEIESLRQTLLRNQGRYERRLTGARNRLGRLAFDPPPQNVFESFHAISDDVDGQRIQISKLRIEIQRARREIQNQVLRRKAEIREVLVQSPEARKLYESLAPDLSLQMREFAMDVELAKAEFAAPIRELRELTEQNEREERELIDVAEKCAVSVHMIEQTYRESQLPLRQLCDQTDRAERVIKGLSHEEKCESLSAELVARNSSLGEEIEDLKVKLASLVEGLS